MNKKLPIGRACLLIDRSISMLQLCSQLNANSQSLKMHFIEPQAGAGFLQWSLPGDDWVPFSDIDNDEKPAVARLYKDRCDAMKQLLEGSDMKDAVLTVPSENDFVFFRKNGGDMEIALAAWGYKYVNIPTGDQIETWIKKMETQGVNIGFAWNGNLLENLPFQLDQFPRATSSDGYFHVGNPIPVGSTFKLETKNGHVFQLVVEKGKSDYVYDITQSAKAEIMVQKDGKALANQSCQVSFNGSNWDLVTDESGRAELVFPLRCDEEGTLPQQPSCKVALDDETQEKIPQNEGDVLRYEFSFYSKPAPEPQPQSVPQSEPEPIPEQTTVRIRLLDYGGYPMPNLPFVLKTKKKGEMTLRTDDDGYCEIMKEWLSNNEKMRVNIVISPEYQESHDLHLKKKKK